MRERGIGFMPILEGDKLVGVITDRDIATRAVSENGMSVEVVCCFEGDSTEHARELMVEHGLRRLPVIDCHHHLVGIIKLAGLDGKGTSVKKALKVIFQKEKTDSSGRPHRVPVKTVYVTGVKTKEAAEAAAVKRVQVEHGTGWNTIADRMEITEES